MKKLFLLSILTIAFTASVVAQDKLSDIKHLLELINSEQMSQNMLNAMIPALKQQIASQVKENSAKEKIDKMMDALTNEMMEEVKELTHKLNSVELVNIYDKHFTQEEIKDLIEFYESPTGKKILVKSPEIAQELMNVMMIKYMPEFQMNLNKRFEELKQ
ncbi:DUF2059 domain-containing protein [Proteiniphilum sp. X52]|uniref:DUF2059 domain-containing protein n=1 Tax=Proteiniphilum sp. X52 TaxID=2382159 RepID=UPI00131425A4|nr:DUF2059 domain-containing protein [Proteiniphilum sp. X52]